MNLQTHLRAGYPGLAVISSEEARTEAEIEAVFIDALHEAFAEGRGPSAKDIVEAMTHTVPLAQLMDGKIAALRHWAKGRAREAANHPHPQQPPPRRRKLTHPLAAARPGCGPAGTAEPQLGERLERQRKSAKPVAGTSSPSPSRGHPVRTLPPKFPHPPNTASRAEN